MIEATTARYAANLLLALRPRGMRSSRCAGRLARDHHHCRAMTMSDLFGDGEEDQSDNQTTESESSTYIRFYDTRHPEAFNALSEKVSNPTVRQVLKQNTEGVKEFYAAFTVELEEAFEEGSSVPLLEFVDPDDETLAEYISDREGFHADEDVLDEE